MIDLDCLNERGRNTSLIAPVVLLALATVIAYAWPEDQKLSGSESGPSSAVYTRTYGMSRRLIH